MSAELGLPRFAAWRHLGARDGFEVVFFDVHAGTIRVQGHTSAVEDDAPFSIHFELELDERWHTRRGRVTGQSLRGHHTTVVEADGEGDWVVNGKPAPELAGCIDLDLEASALTNAFPVHRLKLRPGDAAEATAAYVRAFDLSVGRLEQRYRRIDDDSGRQRYDYAAPAFDFSCELEYDDAGLVVDYPGLAVRVAG